MSEAKKLVDMIRKLADAGDMPTRGGRGMVPPKPAAGPAPAGGGGSDIPQRGGGGGGGAIPQRGQPGLGGGGYAVNTDVVAMQQALQTFAKTVAGQINLDAVSKGGPEADDAKRRDAFGVFLTKNYMRNDQVPAKEYDPTVSETGDSLKGAQDVPTRMSIVMDTMSRIGSPRPRPGQPQGERFVDGNWGPRTENALYNAYAFAAGLLQFVKDVNRFSKKQITLSHYDESNLGTFKKILDLSEDKAQRPKLAKYATEHLQAITQMFNEVKEQVLEHAPFAQYIQGQTPFKSYGPRISPEQLATISKGFPEGIVINLDKLGQHKLPINALQSVDALQNWLAQAVPDAGLTVSDLLKRVRSYVTEGF